MYLYDHGAFINFLGLPHWVYILQKHFPRAIYYNFYRCDSLVM